jgi:hypothetical protein
MKSHSDQLEVLLMTATSFTSNQYSYKGKSPDYSTNELLEDACWNGLFKDMLPEVFKMVPKEHTLFLWKVVQGTFFMKMDYGEKPETPSPYSTINPHGFVPALVLS